MSKIILCLVCLLALSASSVANAQHSRMRVHLIVFDSAVGKSAPMIEG